MYHANMRIFLVFGGISLITSSFAYGPTRITHNTPLGPKFTSPKQSFQLRGGALKNFLCRNAL